MAGVWDYEKMYQRQKEIVDKRYANYHREELLQLIVELRANLYPFISTLGVLDQAKEHRDVAHVSSDLFPSTFDGITTDDLPYAVYNDELKNFEGKAIPIEKLHEVEYALEESIVIHPGQKLDDKFQIICGHMSVYCGYCSYGSISMQDVRRATALMDKE
jgi:hypothetical protein